MKSRWWLLAAVAVGSAMSGLDSSVSNTILPVIATQLHADVASVQWVVLIYLLVLSSLLLSAGRFGDMRGHRGVYLSGFALFVASSGVCAFAPSLGWLVAARACQAFGAALLASNSPAILTNAFPDHQRGRVLGLQATAVYLGLAVGPSLGGLLTSAFGWGSVFLINVPVGLIGLALSVRFVPRDAARTRSAAPFDALGALLFTVGLVAFLWGLNQASDWGWTSPLLAACMSLAIVVLAAFVWLELRVSSPMLDLKLFRIRLFSAAVATATLSYVATFAMTFLLPFYLIEARGLSPAQAGLVLTAMPVFMPVLAALSGAWSDRVGSRLPATLGMSLTACGLFALSTIGLETPLAFVTAGLALIGIGSGLFTSPNTSAVLGAAPRQQRGLASGVVATARNVGMVVGLGLGGAIFSTVLGASAGAPSAATVAQAADTGLRVAAAIAALGAVLSATREPRLSLRTVSPATSEAQSGSGR